MTITLENFEKKNIINKENKDKNTNKNKSN